MFEPLEPKEFCSKWIPIKSDKKPGEYGYRKECCKLLALLTGYNPHSALQIETRIKYSEDKSKKSE